VDFQEAKPGDVPMRELGLTIAGTSLEPILAEFAEELAAVGIGRVKPRFYLSTEWGVPFETIAVAIPFYLARPDLAELHADRTGLVEGFDREDILRYLRHEMGHVLNYAYVLYERADWIQRFGSITQPYVEDYRPEPWSRRFVRHLPGWYAQKHPDEDWAETFALWMTPGFDWRRDYAAWPEALAKLELCDAMMREVRDREPEVTNDELDEDIGEIEYSIEDFYRDALPESGEFPPGLDGGLRAIFPAPARMPDRSAASGLIRSQVRAIPRAVYTWTGHFPEHTRALLGHLAERADDLDLGYAEADEPRVLVALTAFVTSLAMNHVHRGTYLP
jgi:Putative zinc-binding metallo-peptidase